MTVLVDTTTRKLEQIAFYGCGGTGINIGQLLDDDNIKKYYLDSSDSNETAAVVDSVYTIDGLDGGGGVRTVVNEAFKGQAPQVLAAFPPSNICNVFAHSLTGATGSTTSQYLVRECLERKLPVVVVVEARAVLGGELKNAINTLKGYAAVASRTGMPVMIYLAMGDTESESDEEIVKCIELISLAVDKRRTFGSDRKDFFHFINYNVPTGIKEASICQLSVVENTEDNEVNDTGKRNKIIATSLLLTKDKDSRFLGVQPLHGKRVIVTDPDFSEDFEFRLDNIVGEIQDIMTEMAERKKASDTLLESTKISAIDVSGGDDDDFFD